MKVADLYMYVVLYREIIKGKIKQDKGLHPDLSLELAYFVCVGKRLHLISVLEHQEPGGGGGGVGGGEGGVEERNIMTPIQWHNHTML